MHRNPPPELQLRGVFCLLAADQTEASYRITPLHLTICKYNVLRYLPEWKGKKIESDRSK